jgi:hypothetical protein
LGIQSGKRLEATLTSAARRDSLGDRSIVPTAPASFETRPIHTPNLAANALGNARVFGLNDETIAGPAATSSERFDHPIIARF